MQIVNLLVPPYLRQRLPGGTRENMKKRVRGNTLLPSPLRPSPKSLIGPYGALLQVKARQFAVHHRIAMRKNYTKRKGLSPRKISSGSRAVWVDASLRVDISSRYYTRMRTVISRSYTRMRTVISQSHTWMRTVISRSYTQVGTIISRSCTRMRIIIRRDFELETYNVGYGGPQTLINYTPDCIITRYMYNSRLVNI